METGTIAVVPVNAGVEDGNGFDGMWVGSSSILGGAVGAVRSSPSCWDSVSACQQAADPKARISNVKKTLFLGMPLMALASLELTVPLFMLMPYCQTKIVHND